MKINKRCNKLFVIIFAIFLLSCCSKIDDSTVHDYNEEITDNSKKDDISDEKPPVNEDSKSEDRVEIDNDNTQEKKDENILTAENKVINEVSNLSGVQALVNSSFKVDNTYYVVVKIPDVNLSFGEYTHIWDSTKGEEVQGAYSYELWKYNDGKLQRLIYNSLSMSVDNYENNPDGNFIRVKGDWNNYIIKYNIDNSGYKQ